MISVVMYSVWKWCHLESLAVRFAYLEVDKNNSKHEHKV